MSNCENWTGCVKNGYGWRTWKRATTTAHRIEFCKANGLELVDIEGLMVRHKCDNPLCINPEHLEIGTHQDNMNDMISRGRGFRKFSENVVEAIKREYVHGSSSCGSTALAKKYGISQGHAFQIIHGTALSGVSMSDVFSAFGEDNTISEWAKDDRCTVSGKTIMRRICSGMRPEEAITSPRSKPGMARHLKSLASRQLGEAA